MLEYQGTFPRWRMATLKGMANMHDVHWPLHDMLLPLTGQGNVQNMSTSC